MARLCSPEEATRARSTRLLPAIRLPRAAARTQNHWIDRLAGATPWLGELSTRLGQALHRPVVLREEPIRLEQQVVAGEGRLLMPLELQPGGPGVILDLDSDLAAAAVDALLAGPGTPPSVLRPLTWLDRGALSYLVLLACRELQQRTGLRIHLLSLGGDDAELPAIPHLIQPLRVGLGDLAGEIRLRLPLEGPTPDLLAEPPLTGTLAETTLSSALELRAAVGQGTLPWREIRLLSPGDMLFLDRLTVDGTGRGDAVLCCGSGASTLPCRCEVPDSGPIRLTLLGPATPAGPRLEKEIMTDNKESTESTAAATVSDAPAAAMLDDVPVTLTLELGRLSLSARELLSLRVGHVIELDRAHGDPLDVSVNGQAIARGELVEVEGRLGVRIERLVGR